MNVCSTAYCSVNAKGRSVHLILWSIWRQSWVTQSQLLRRPSNSTQPVHVRNACRVSVIKEALGRKLPGALPFKMIRISKDKSPGTQKTILSLTVQLKSPWFPLLVADPKEKAKVASVGRGIEIHMQFPELILHSEWVTQLARCSQKVREPWWAEKPKYPFKRKCQLHPVLRLLSPRGQNFPFVLSIFSYFRKYEFESHEIKHLMIWLQGLLLCIT